MDNLQGRPCEWCGDDDEVELCTVDGHTDGKGNAIGVSLCGSCRAMELGGPSDAYCRAAERRQMGIV